MLLLKSTIEKYQRALHQYLISFLHVIAILWYSSWHQTHWTQTLPFNINSWIKNSFMDRIKFELFFTYFLPFQSNTEQSLQDTWQSRSPSTWWANETAHDGVDVVSFDPFAGPLDRDVVIWLSRHVTGDEAGVHLSRQEALGHGLVGHHGFHPTTLQMWTHIDEEFLEIASSCRNR